MRFTLLKTVLALGLGASLAMSSAAAAASAGGSGGDAKAKAAEKRDEFILGNIVFVLFHEFGHALVSEFELPVLGREEDAVDRFATFLLSPEGGEDEDSDPSTILVDAMRGWFAASEQTELSEIEWWGEHGPDQQRGYQIACLLYGADPEKFADMADDIALPAARKETCPAEAESNSQSWVKVAAPHVLDDGEKPRRRISVSYGAAGAYQAEKALLEESGLLEAMASEFTGIFRLPRNLTIAAKACGEPNAFWDPEAAEIQICYELLREYRGLHGQAEG